MQHLFSLKNKNIVITGASSGIGRQCAISCSKMGATIILIARNKNRLIDTYNKLDEGKHLYFIQDITDYDKIEAIINDVCSKLGKIHGFIHSAGIEMTTPFKIMKPEYYSQLFNINVVSGFNIS